MKKVGRLIEPLLQLCYAHGVQLGITDVIYKKTVQSNPEEEFEDPELNTNRSAEEEEVLGDNPDNYDEKLVSSMNNHISERRIKATAVLLYLKNPNIYQDDLEQWKGNETFQLPSKYLIRKEIKNIITRLYRKANQAEINTTVLNEDDLPLSMIAEDLSLRAIAAQNYTSLQEDLEETLRASKTESPFKPMKDQRSLVQCESVVQRSYFGAACIARVQAARAHRRDVGRQYITITKQHPTATELLRVVEFTHDE
ncbi:hypothetical protein EVAR_18979_1 [Eumeta japonica]|uniref:Uncharacterized protein n=1 Tax=Eumeta variegata TaxID=151549 RepID=A0A4C1WW77_EUMVA|nr:hypothetical protein EVAR_18979_1 [Eumeta japonica]